MSDNQNTLTMVGQGLADPSDRSQYPGYVQLYRNSTHEFRVVVAYDRRDEVYKVLNARARPLDSTEPFVQFFDFCDNFFRPMLLNDVVLLVV